MKERTIRKINIAVFAVLTAAMCVLIFYMSSMDADHSSDLTSGGFGAFLKKIVSVLPQLTGEGVDADVRKYAHIFEFLLLGVISMFLSWEIWHPVKIKYIGSVDPKSSHSIYGGQVGYVNARGTSGIPDIVKHILSFGCSLVFSFLYACSDEWHQTFISGRSGNINDVLRFDLPGLAAGVIIALIISLIIRRPKNNSRDRYVDIT